MLKRLKVKKKNKKSLPMKTKKIMKKRKSLLIRIRLKANNLLKKRLKNKSKTKIVVLEAMITLMMVKKMMKKETKSMIRKKNKKMQNPKRRLKISLLPISLISNIKMQLKKRLSKRISFLSMKKLPSPRMLSSKSSMNMVSLLANSIILNISFNQVNKMMVLLKLFYWLTTRLLLSLRKILIMNTKK